MKGKRRERMAYPCSSQLVKHPMFWRCKTLEMFLWSSCHFVCAPCGGLVGVGRVGGV